MAIALGLAAAAIVQAGMASPPATQAASLSLNGSSKNVEPPLIQPGHLVTYTIVLSNDASTPITATVVDYSPPGMTYITGTLPGTLWGISTDVLTWTGRLNAYQVVTITFRGQADSGLSDGTHITNTAAISDGLNQLERSATVVIDTQAPSLMFESPQLGEVITSATVTASGLAWDAGQSPFPPSPVLNPINNNGGGYYFVTWSATEAGALYLLEEDTSLTFPDPSIPYSGTDTTTPLLVRGAGTYYYRVKAITTQGASPWSNVVSATVTTLDAAYDTRLLASTQLTSTLSSVWVQIDSSPWFQASGTLHWTYQFPLPTSDYAAHTLRAYARDIAGNTNPTATLTFFADRLAPLTTITNLTQSQIIHGPYIIQGNVGIDASGVKRVIVRIDDGAVSLDYTATGTLTWNYAWSPVGAFKPYTITAFAIDGVGNVGASSASYQVSAGHYQVYLPTVMKRWPPVPFAPNLGASSVDSSGAFTLTWSYPNSNIPVVTYTLQEAADAVFKTDARNYYPGTGTVFKIVHNPTGLYYYRVQGNNSYGGGDWSNIVSVTVAPDTPVLQPINNPDQLVPYVISWTTSASAEYYVLEEASTSNFTDTNAIYNGSAISHTVSSQGNGVYFYRVKAFAPPVSSQWSNVVSTTVKSFAFHDDFNDPSTGWTVRRTSSPTLTLATTRYVNGTLRTGLDDKFDSAIFSPLLPAPSTPYRIRMRTRIINTANQTSYGIIFGGNSGEPCPNDRSNAGEPGGCFFHHYRINVVWGGDYLRGDAKRIDYHEADKGKGRGVKLMFFEYLDGVTVHDAWNDWEIRVYEDGFSLYVNGHKLDSTTDTRYIHDPLYGMFISTGEYNHALFENDYFYVEPLPAASMLEGGSEDMAQPALHSR